MYQKNLSNSETKFKAGDQGLFTGYGSVFNSIDSYGDTIMPGAFKNTLQKNGMPKMFFNHDSWMGMPIGKYLEVKEDDYGLVHDGELTLGMSKADDVYAGMKHGTVEGMSIGFYLDKDDFEENEETGGLIIHRVTKLVETSVVVFPAEEKARIDLDSVKFELESIDSEKEFERFLREVGGFSNGVSKALLARARKILALRDEGSDPEQLKALEDRLLNFKIPNF